MRQCGGEKLAYSADHQGLGFSMDTGHQDRGKENDYTVAAHA